MKRQIFLILSILSFGFSTAVAQTTPAQVKTISGGVVNGKALSLGKPAYPAAARAVNAEGAVNVQVEIDEEGNVVSANPVSGHPLLREAAREAALQSKFKPTLLSSQAVKVTGVLVYNFVADATPNWLKVGYDLASVQHAPSLVFLNTNAIAKLFQTDWTSEKE
ncbi:MAG: energy transducer TonB [Acidobacteria bacterium]|nr:energy transducer TonB [Acidobacteriota bacterium]MCA1636839.1 energy transducer TonB [Acidobacteriota bacterium]